MYFLGDLHSFFDLYCCNLRLFPIRYEEIFQIRSKLTLNSFWAVSEKFLGFLGAFYRNSPASLKEVSGKDSNKFRGRSKYFSVWSKDLLEKSDISCNKGIK